MQLWGITDRGSVRKENQDAYITFLLDGVGGVGAVCDGMGGALAGNVASQLALDTFSGALRDGFSQDEAADPKTVLSQAVELANNQVYRRSLEDEDCHGMGTTIVAAVADAFQISVINVGDSRCYLANEEGITRVTRDHSLVEDLVVRGDITPEEARHHPRRNLITRALGVEEKVESDLYQVAREEGSFVLLCSDGLSNVLTDHELLYEIIHGGSSSSCCQRLLDIALSRGAPDNVTAVLMQL